jgi:hypothetical protein
MSGALITMLAGMQIMKSLGKGFVDRLISKSSISRGIEVLGYGYDQSQDIFYCNMNPWQRNMGYNRLYDEAMAPLGMIVDCEPIYFEYDNKIWLIELWKGEYDVNTGGEVGIYTMEKPLINIPEMYKYFFYKCAGNEDRLPMSFTLINKKIRDNDDENENGVIFERNDQHWWLGGFKLGEYSEPSDLIMYVTITFKDEVMRKAFVEAIEKIGYIGGLEGAEFKTIDDGDKRKVKLTFDKPHTPQPITRNPESDKIIQAKNKLLCESYNDITKMYDSIEDKLNVVKKYAPGLYERIIEKAKLIQFLRTMKDTGVI